VVVIGFVDDPRTPRVRIVLDEPLYIQMPWRFSGRTADADRFASCWRPLPCTRGGSSPTGTRCRRSYPRCRSKNSVMPDQEGATLLTFVSQGSTPAEPPCFVLARRMTVVTQPEAG
jgi:hypothetical protein